MDLVTVGNQLVSLAEKEKDNEILELAQMKRARAYFSLLVKIAMYGFEVKTDNEKKIITDLTCELKKHYCLLMKSPMPINRKVMMSLLCINFNCLKFPIIVFKLFN
jgi:hypothetical protein